MKVLYCVSEVAPIIKVGGLGDVAGSLPKALAKLGVEISLVVPKYEETKSIKDTEKITNFEVEFAGKVENVTVWKTRLPDSTVPVFLLANETYLSKDGHVAFAGTEKEIERFAFFSKSIAELINCQLITPDPEVLHLNDWHVSLTPVLLKSNHVNLSSLLTIHNLSYQGISGLSLLSKTGLPPDSCRVLRWDAQNRDIDILMEGVIHADFINTVSPTYAREIITSEYGEGIEEVLKAKAGRVTGILNGIDYEVWNPERDNLINFQFSSSPYRVNKFQLGKEENKLFLQKELGLEVNKSIPLVAFIGRLEPKQKGLDILYEALEKLLPENNFQFVLLGTGDKEWEEKFKVQSEKFKVSMRFINRFDEKLAHQIYAGADLLLMPSKFEPCGLPQMIAMRYGTLPLVRKVGGLADTVVDHVNGFVFEEYANEALIKVIKRAMEQWNNRTIWEQMIENAMKQDFSWESSARQYLELYKKIGSIGNW